jgi:hypothetical protein
MKKLAMVAMGAAMAFLLSSCFVLQGFSVLANSVRPGNSTKAQFVLHPFQEAREYPPGGGGVAIRTNYQFVVVGVPTSGDLTVGGATWGTNGSFGGPQAMHASAALPAAMDSAGCSSNGLDFSSISNTTWKGFLTLAPINDKGAVNDEAVVKVVIKAKASAATATSNAIFGVQGTWTDDGDGVVNDADTFTCMGIASSSLYVR